MGDSDPREGDVFDLLSEVGGRLVDALVRGGRSGARQLRDAGGRWARLVQARRDLDVLYNKLGREVVQLVEAGEIDHPGLVARTRRIQDQLERIEGLRASLREGEAGAADDDLDPSTDND